MVIASWDTSVFKDKIKKDTDNKKLTGCPCGRSPTGKCVGWHRLSDKGYIEMYAKYQKVRKSKRSEFFKNNKVPKNKVKEDSTALFDLHNINRMESDDFDPGQE